MPAGFRASVPPISGDPSPYGLLGGCVEVITTNDMHELNGTQTLGPSCSPANQWYDCGATQQNPASKIYDKPQTCLYDPVTVYAGVTCSTFGLSHEEGQAWALEQLRLGEQRALEDFYQRYVLSAYAVGNDLTPVAGALNVTAALGVLEGWLAQNYGGRGVVHIPTGAASMFSRDHLTDFPDEDQAPATLAGNCLVIGGGYMANIGPGGAVAPSGEMWLYITPPVRVRRDVPFLAPGSEALSVNTTTNDRLIQAETTFVPETRCCTAAAVRATIC